MHMPSIRLDLESSKVLAVLFSFLHLGAIGMLLLCLSSRLSFFYLFIFCSFLVAIIVSWHHCLQKHAFKTHVKAVRSLSFLNLENKWLLTLANGQQKKFTLLSDSVLFLGLALLKFKEGDRFLCSAVVICQDGIKAQQFKQLCKWWKIYEKSQKCF